MEFGALIFLLVLFLAVAVVECAIEAKEKKAKTERYIATLEKQNEMQARALQHYRFDKFIEDTEEM